MERLRELLKEVLNRHPDIKLCIAFGSMAGGNASPDSDLDIAIAAEKPLPPNKLLELSEELSPETHCETDLVDLMAATGAILKQALSTGIVV